MADPCQVESSGHVFWHCARAKEVLSAANVEFEADLGEGIWTNRNEIRTSGARKSASAIAYWTLDYLVEFQVVNHKIQWREDGVVGIDNFNEFYDPTLKRTRQALLEYSGVLIVEGDINDMMLLKKLFELVTFTHVLHLATQAGVRSGWWKVDLCRSKSTYDLKVPTQSVSADQDQPHI
nr:udp-glucuronate 4-epimerase 3 [Quercus suber]